jgi:hypothetical protein
MAMAMDLTIEAVRNRATERIEAFRELTDEIPYESKGILFQEAFFVYACLANATPRRLLESGRARGQSTMVFCRSFPDSTVVSIEFDRNSPDVPVAEERLAGEKNVELHYGDAREVIPGMLQEGDVVVIDGPKEHRALALAYQILGTGRCPAVFIHDCYKGSPIRKLIDTAYPSAVFSDDPAFVAAHKALDEKRIVSVSETGDNEWRPYNFTGHSQISWGPTFACLPHVPGFAYGVAKVRVELAAILYRLLRSIAKRRKRQPNG